MKFSLLPLSILPVAFGAITGPDNLLVSLPYAKYQGYFNSTSSLNTWLGVRFAAPPTGENRWKVAQQPAVPSDGMLKTIQANQLPKQCPQTTPDFAEDTDDEDCLFLNVYAPKNAKNLPVLVWIHGGSWQTLSASDFDPSPMINVAGNNFVAVIIQYRLGLFGFLAGSPQVGSAFNAGIKDSRFALEWVQSYISHFGGSKDKVTLWGESSGGGTILELVAQESAQQHAPGQELFHASVLSSPWLPPIADCMDDFFVNQFQNITAAAGCPNDLECLRKVDTATLKKLNFELDMVPPSFHRPNFYTTCIETTNPGAYIKRHPLQAIQQGDVYGRAIIAGSNTADGAGTETFITTPADLSTPALWDAWISANWPLSQSEQQQVAALYPQKDFASSHDRGVALYQDVTYSCAATALARDFGNRGLHSYRYLFAIPLGLHMQDTAYEFPIAYSSRSPISPSFSASFIGEIGSFIRSYNPNINRPALADTLKWPSVTPSNQQTKVFNMTETSSANLINASLQPISAVLTGTDERCAFWTNVRLQNGW